MALAACTYSGAADGTRPYSPPSPVQSPTAAPTPTAPTAPPVDAADVSTWIITADRIGPIERGADPAGVVDALTTFQAIDWCQGFMRLERDATAGIVLGLSEDGARIGTIWVHSRGADGVDSPVTEAGIRLGSSTAELTAAYPDAASVGQAGADAWVSAVQVDADSWMRFITEGDVVTVIGASDQTGLPKEPCA